MALSLRQPEFSPWLRTDESHIKPLHTVANKNEKKKFRFSGFCVCKDAQRYNPWRFSSRVNSTQESPTPLTVPPWRGHDSSRHPAQSVVRTTHVQWGSWFQDGRGAPGSEVAHWGHAASLETKVRVSQAWERLGLRSKTTGDEGSVASPGLGQSCSTCCEGPHRRSART